MFESFFNWWGKLTGTKPKHYRIGSRVIGVNWSIVTFVIVIWVLMLLFLPW